ncbi:DNA-binding transcriptional regulator, MarR family [[Clostridium] aminophilum]|uniref:DNA-binding transcriptional regulator, MarR family n=1 Tax=[Clostridium] aminophilum TaxID=1526 RepID=A0A1I0E895_9FIRM|nr:MarR family transcriptional regulator [[Clostridium] aminophilum]SET41403.1 DNA-binding transcriptional regulator, MarR family [[Clostridium] aminophilum]
MLADIIVEIYDKCRIYFLMKIFSRFENREATLTTVESFSMECIHALGEPTVAEFAAMMGISAPNAAYKVNSLIQKGYIEKVQSTDDRREFFLRPTRKFMDYYDIGLIYGRKLEARCRERFSKEDLEKLESMMKIISDELMPELDLSRFKTHKNDEKA